LSGKAPPADGEIQKGHTRRTPGFGAHRALSLLVAMCVCVRTGKHNVKSIFATQWDNSVELYQSAVLDVPYSENYSITLNNRVEQQTDMNNPKLMVGCYG
jgi:hypothetical protein